MLRFRRMKTLQQFASVHSALHNHFNQERHLTSRDQVSTDSRLLWAPRVTGLAKIRRSGTVVTGRSIFRSVHTSGNSFADPN